jgi:WD40 repeat protein
LQYFDEADAPRFFGRERLVARLLGRLRTERFLVVIGASGSGKSSLLRAGVVPNLRQHSTPWPSGDGSFTVYLLTPTAHPIDSLAAAVAGPDASVERAAALRESLARDPRGLRIHLRQEVHQGRGLVVVDQFEELFTLCHDSFEQEAFVDNLLAAADEADGRAGVLLALRADFYAHCAQFADLRAMLARHQEYVGSMVPEELRHAIQGPAEGGNWSLEPGLVELVLRDAGEEPGALPLLSHAMLETWRRRRGRRLTLAGYADSGGVRGAIARSADDTLQRLTVDQQSLARRIFVRLTELGEGTQDTRRRATFEELVAAPEDMPAVLEVLEVLAAARLVTLGENTVEVAHEALIREWPALRAWLDEDRAALRLHRALGAAARDWEAHEHDPDLVYRGARLAQVREWAETHGADLNSSERSFLDASIALAERQFDEREALRRRELEAAQQLASAEQRRAEDQTRATARLRRRAISLAGALLLALGMAGTALFFADRAREGTALAQANARIASARELAAAAFSSLDADPERSILLAQQAVMTTYRVDGTWTSEAENALHRAVLTSRARLTLNNHTGPVSAVTFSPDGSKLATAGEDGIIRVSDAATGAELWNDSGQSGVRDAIAFSPDGTWLAATGKDNSVQVVSALSGEPHLALRGHAAPVTSIAYSVDGARIATAGQDGAIRLWDAASGAALRTVYGSDVRDLGFSPDGTRLFTVEDGGTISVWNATDSSQILPVMSLRIDGEGRSAAFSPNGVRLAAVDGTDVRVWDAETGKELQRFTASGTNLTRVAYSPDGTRLAVAGLDRQVTIWEARTGGQPLSAAASTASGRLLITLAGHLAPIADLAFSPDSLRLSSAAEDGTTKVWDLTPAHEVVALPYPDWPGPFASQVPPLSLNRIVYDAGGTRLAVGLQDGRVQLWDAGLQVQRLGGYQAEKAGVAIAFSPDGRLLATGGGDGVIKLWEAASGAELRQYTAHHGVIFGLAFSADGRRLASAGDDATAKIWNVAPGDAQPILVLTAHTAAVSGVAFSPDGRRLATSSVDGTVRIWDADTGAPVMVLGAPSSDPVGIGRAGLGLQPLHALSELATLPDAVWSVAYSPDGERLITAGRAATIWDANSGQQLIVLRGHVGTVVQAVFNRDGRMVATASRDGTAKIWESATGTNLLTLYGGNEGAGGLNFNPDGTRLAVSADDATRVHVVRMEDLLALASARLTRSWTDDECRLFLHQELCPT